MISLTGPWGIEGLPSYVGEIIFSLSDLGNNRIEGRCILGGYIYDVTGTRNENQIDLKFDWRVGKRDDPIMSSMNLAGTFDDENTILCKGYYWLATRTDVELKLIRKK